jgi:hypothetical protein
MRLFPLGVEHALNTPIERLHHADARELRWPFNSAIKITAFIRQ